MGPETGVLFGFTDLPLVVDGCYVDEIVRRSASRCLRFDTIVGNFGEGAFEATYEIDTSKKLASAYQHIYRADGTYTERFATRSEYHPTHVHFHIADFYTARLWRSTPNGGHLDATPIAGGAKNGFCPADIERVEGQNQDEPAEYMCFADFDFSEPVPRQVVGISAGWQDIYNYELPDQYVEISDVGNGYYALEIQLDPRNVFVESDETNNTVCVVIELRGVTARLLDPSPPC